MEYIINTSFLGEDISYDLIHGKFSFQNDNNLGSLVGNFQSIVEHGILLKNIVILCVLLLQQQTHVI